MPGEISLLFIELGLVIVGLAVAARVSSRLGFALGKGGRSTAAADVSLRAIAGPILSQHRTVKPWPKTTTDGCGRPFGAFERPVFKELTLARRLHFMGGRGRQL